MDILSETPADLLIMVLEVTVLFFCLWPVYISGGLGAGDCKLLLTAGVFLPVKQAVIVVISTFFIAALEIILLRLVYRIKREKWKTGAIHFAPSFLGAVLLCQGWQLWPR